MKKAFTICLFLFGFYGFGQSDIDSLKQQAGLLELDSNKVLTYIRIAIGYNRINYDSALYYAKKSEKLSRQLNSDDLLGRSKYRTATVLVKRNQFDAARAELDTAISLLSSSGNVKRLLSAKVEIGRIYQRSSDFEEAVEWFFESLQLAEEVKDKNAEARIKNYLASIYNYQKQYDLAITYFKESLNLVEELNFKPGISAVSTNLGEVYNNQEKYDSAIIYQRKALKLKEELGDKLGKGRVYNNIANVFANTSPPSLDSALYYYQKGLSISEEIKDRRLLATHLYGIVRVHFMKGNFELAEESVQRLIPMLEQIQDLSLANNSNDVASLVYAGLGDIEKAFYYRGQSNILADSLLSIERIRLANELEAEYQSKTKQRAIDLLKAENDLQELQIKKRRNERNSLIILSIVVLLVLGLLINQYRIKQASNKKLKELDRIKSTFFENLSHEFRTPLSLIKAPIKDRLKKSSGAEEDDFLNLVLRNAENLDELIKQLLDLAKLEKGKYELNNSPVEATRFFRVLAASYESLSVMKGITFDVIVPKEEKWLELDGDLLRKLCNNLLSNAFKFTPENGSIILEIGYNDSLNIRVWNSGKGIPDEEQHLIFDRFYQAEGPRSSGTGIGLALTKELTEVAGGQITLESDAENGTTFSISLPLIAAEPIAAEILPADETGSEVMNNEPSFLPERQNLLIIEDNEDLRGYLSGIFQPHFNTYVAVNGKAGITEAMETIPDLIISDIMMDEMDGLEVCRLLKSDQRTDHIPIILLTAKTDQETKLTSIQHGADAYLLKPFESEELKALVNNLIDQRQKLRGKYADTRLAEKDEADTHPFIQKCEEVTGHNLSNEAFTADEFAREMAMSRMQLHRKLKAMTGLSTTAFVRHQRLLKAKSLLEHGEPVSQVAYAVGFSSLAYFSKSFKEEFGMLPSQAANQVT